MKFESLEQGNLSRAAALAEVAAIREQVIVMGANDSESSEFKIIIDKLEKGELKPEVALTHAQNILNSKQDYH